MGWFDRDCRTHSSRNASPPAVSTGETGRSWGAWNASTSDSVRAGVDSKDATASAGPWSECVCQATNSCPPKYATLGEVLCDTLPASAASATPLTPVPDAEPDNATKPAPACSRSMTWRTPPVISVQATATRPPSAATARSRTSCATLPPAMPPAVAEPVWVSCQTPPLKVRA